ncbi:MAG: PhoU domain-containing protein [Nitrososphaeria archaeon]
MGKLTIRKLQKVGKSSYSLILPKYWINRLNIGPQDPIAVEDYIDELRIRPASSKTSAGTTDLTIELKSEEDFEKVSRKVISAYLAGCNVITLKADSERLPLSLKDNLKNLVSEFTIGLEVIEEGKRTIKFQEIVSNPTLNFDGIVRRMYNISLDMLNLGIKSFIENSYEDAQSVIKADVDVDKFYLYGIRAINNAAENSSFLREIGFAKPGELLIAKSILKSIERIADHAVSISKLVFMNLQINEEDLKFIEDQSQQALKIYSAAYESIMMVNEDIANSVISETNRFVGKLSNHHIQGHAITVLEHLIRIAEYSADIGENIIDLIVSRSI